TRDEFRALTPQQQRRVSRDILTAADIKALISAAIELHTRALEEKRESRWWIPLVTGLAWPDPASVPQRPTGQDRRSSSSCAWALRWSDTPQTIRFTMRNASSTSR